MRAILIVLGVINGVIALLLPDIGKARHVATMGDVRAIYEAPTKATDASDSYAKMWASTLSRDGKTTNVEMAFLASQGVLLLVLGICSKKCRRTSAAP